VGQASTNTVLVSFATNVRGNHAILKPTRDTTLTLDLATGQVTGTSQLTREGRSSRFFAAAVTDEPLVEYLRLHAA